MKTHKLRLANFAAAATLAAATVNTHSQDWETVDEFLPGYSASSGEIAADGLGNVFAAGTGAVDPSATFALVRTSSFLDQGAGGTWDTVEDYLEPGWRGAHYRAVTSDLNGRLYVAGEMYPTPGSDRAWVVREWNGVGWTTADFPFPLDGANYATCADIKVSPYNGDVYAVGQSFTTVESGGLGKATWVVRRRAADSSQFTTVDKLVQNTGASAWHVGFHPTRGVLVVGVTEGRWGNVWTVRSSFSGDMNTWNTIDSFVDNKVWIRSSAKGIAVTSSGTIYVSGSAYNSKTGKNHWIVRSSTDGGATWTIADDFKPAGDEAVGNGIALDLDENPVVAGYTKDSAGSLSWLVRRGTPEPVWVKQGKQLVEVTRMAWKQSDPWKPNDTLETRANGVTADPLGNLFVSGRATDASGISRWIVRRLVAP